MTNLCTKVTVRKRPISNGQMSLYLDFYPEIRNPKTGKMTRREYLGIYIYAKPKEKFELEYNKTMIRNAELIKCRRIESIVSEDFGFLDRSKGRESFVEYFKKKANETSNKQNWDSAIKHFQKYCDNECCFNDLSIEFCQGFLTYLLNLVTQNKVKMMASTANNNLNKLKAAVRMAHEDGFIKVNIASKLTNAKVDSKPRDFLTLEEVKKLANAPCGSDVLKRAGLFSCLTGLRISDVILLQWENVQKASDGGWCIIIQTKKTKTNSLLPISDEAFKLCGERGERNVFPELNPNIVRANLPNWLKAAKINKHITFHCFRHTYATLQLAAGTDLYTISKMLTHSNIGTTQVYADVVNELKREASNKISLQ